MNRSVSSAVAIAVAILAPRLAAAQSVPPATPAKVFVAVDAVKLDGAKVVVTGILQGDATPSTWSVSYYSGLDAALKAEFLSSCHTQALLAMTKPGLYLLEILSASGTSLPACKLTRANP